MANCLPPERLEIRLDVTGPESRRIELRALGARYEAVLDQLSNEL